MPRASLLNLYTTFVISAGLLTLGITLFFSTEQLLHFDELPFLIFTLAVVLGELAPIRVPGHSTELAISTTFIFALMLGYGPESAIAIQAFASGIADLRNGKPARRTLFNVAQYTLAWAAAGSIVTGLVDLNAQPAELFSAVNLPAFALASCAFFVVNSLLVRSAVAISRGQNPGQLFMSDLPFRAWTTAMLMGLAPAVCAVQNIDLVLSMLIVLPVAAIHRAASESARNEYLATHDALTGMPNRVFFQSRVAEEIAHVTSEAKPLAVLLLDLDRFKEINDTLGHHQGDTLLQQIRPRLENVLGEDSLAARLGGDEFAVLVRPGSTHPDAVLAEAQRVRDALTDGFEIDGVMLDVGASIGVAIYPHHGRDVDTLMKAADVAMYGAKDGATGVQLYEAEDDNNSVRRLAMARELRLALEGRELTLHYQPKLDLVTDEVREVEALVRWVHPERGMVSPSEFIPLAEQAGLIMPLTRLVVEQALDQVKAWRDEGIELCVAVNLSVRSLLDGGLLADVRELLAQCNLRPSTLRFEITESALMSDAVRAGRILRMLSAMGIRLALDDFGTGYSSLSYLKSLPVDEVKIDRSFVMNMSRDPDDAHIVRSTVELTRGLGRTAVAEGVEDQGTLERLRAFGCDAAQGYHISRPQTAGDLTHWLRARRLVDELAPAPGVRSHTETIPPVRPVQRV